MSRRAPFILAAAFVVLALATACSTAPSPIPRASSSATPSVSLPAPLAGTTWRLVSIQDLRPQLGPDVTVAFTAGEISGNGGCNAFTGSYMLDPASGSFRIGELGATKRACVEPARNELENAFFASLRGAATASLAGDGRLVLSGVGAKLVLERAPGQG